MVVCCFQLVHKQHGLSNQIRTAFLMNVLDFLDITCKALYPSSTVLQTANILKRCGKIKIVVSLVFLCKFKP